MSVHLTQLLMLLLMLWHQHDLCACQVPYVRAFVREHARVLAIFANKLRSGVFDEAYDLTFTLLIRH